MKEKPIHIKIMTFDKTKGHKNVMQIKGTLVAENFTSDHDIAAQLFALEFAANNHAELPLRVHITLGQ